MEIGHCPAPDAPTDEERRAAAEPRS